MISTKTINDADLSQKLAAIGLKATAANLDDLIARAAKGRWSPSQLLEEIARFEAEGRAERNLTRRVSRSRLGRFKPMADFDWNWPKKIDQTLIQQALELDFITNARNLILMGANGLGKTMIAKNIAHQALLAGHTVLFKTASEIISDLGCDSPALRRYKLNEYSRMHLLCIDLC